MWVEIGIKKQKTMIYIIMTLTAVSIFFSMCYGYKQLCYNCMWYSLVTVIYSFKQFGDMSQSLVIPAHALHSQSDVGVCVCLYTDTYTKAHIKSSIITPALTLFCRLGSASAFKSCPTILVCPSKLAVHRAVVPSYSECIHKYSTVKANCVQRLSLLTRV